MIPNVMSSFATADSEWADTSFALRGDEIHSQDCWLYGDPSPRTPILYPHFKPGS